MRKNLRTRSAFTLVELLVAAALSLVIMGIIAVAFQKSIDAFRTLRSVSQMQERLKSVHMVLKRDLEADHFVAGPANSWNKGALLSDQRLDDISTNRRQPGGQGFFSIMQGPASVDEGADSDGLHSFRAVTHSMHFTAKLQPDKTVTTFSHEEDFFYAKVQPGGVLAGRCPPDFARPSGDTFASQWAELMYFLKPNGSNANGDPNQPLYALYRRQRLLLDPAQASNNTGVRVAWNAGLEQTYPDVSWGPNPQLALPPGAGSRVNTSTDVTFRGAPGNGTLAIPGGNRMPIFHDATVGNWRTFTLGELTANGPLTGDDILLTDVLSFEIKAFWKVGSASMAFENPRPSGPAPNNPDWPYDYLPTLGGANPRNPQQYNDATYPARTFDTWSTTDGGPQHTFNPFPPPKGTTNFGVDWNRQIGVGTSAGYGFSEFANNGPGHWRPPLRIRIMSLQIRVRVWDEAAKTARQITIVQDMTRNNNN